ncbi:hypothetical protein MASR2M15_01540 [Anaerolineales bacterium]
MSNLIFTTIKKRGQRLIFAGLLFLVILIIVSVLTANYLKNAYFGPYEKTPEEIVALDSAENLDEYYVTVTTKDVFDSGYYYYEEMTGGFENVTERFLVMVADEKLLLIQVGKSEFEPERSNTYTGYLKPFSDEIQREIIDDVIRTEPEVADLLVPFMLKSDSIENYRIGSFIYLPVALIVILFSLFLLLKGFRYLSNPLSHPAIKSLDRYGDPEDVLHQIESDIVRGEEKFGHITLTDKWLITHHTGTLSILKLDDLIWASKKIIQNRNHKTHYIRLFDRFGKEYMSTEKEANIDALLARLQTRLPWVIYGYTPDLERTWKQEQARFIATVDENKAKVKNPPPNQDTY